VALDGLPICYSMGGANHSNWEGKSARGEQARRQTNQGRTSQRANHPRCGGESARGWTSQGVNQTGGKTAKGRKNHNSTKNACLLWCSWLLLFATAMWQLLRTVVRIRFILVQRMMVVGTCALKTGSIYLHHVWSTHLGNTLSDNCHFTTRSITMHYFAWLFFL